MSAHVLGLSASDLFFFRVCLIEHLLSSTLCDTQRSSVTTDAKASSHVQSDSDSDDHDGMSYEDFLREISDTKFQVIRVPLRRSKK